MLAIPSRLHPLVSGAPEEASVLGLLERAGQVLADNKTPFFPDYTDHGEEHVQHVLDAAARLIPDAVLDGGLLHAADAAVLCGAVVLHDIAMHVREGGFVELIDRDSPFRPLPWFRERHGQREADRPWAELWETFKLEAQHFSKSRLDALLGPAHGGIPGIAYGDRDGDPASWTTEDRLLVGEFLRRHHARLAHEISLHGFPGARGELADSGGGHGEMIGLTARSHGESLRAMIDYLEYCHPGSKRPGGAVVPYIMGLLRVADFLQLDRSRAPTLLLRLRNPQSRTSIDEWNKHGAVVRVEWDHQDPAAFYVEIMPTHGLRTHLQVEQLLREFQAELDMTTAVLSETYPAEPLSALRLSRQRVRSNLSEPSLHERLPYVPRAASLRSADDVFRLIVSDLYGNQPVVGGRELLQNAVDAVRERRRWEFMHGQLPDGSLYDTEGAADVVVAVCRSADGHALEVTDRGIGMTADTIVEYFLAAGASFGPNRSDHGPADARQAVEWMKAGRFGIGGFAAFLVGPEITVRTRHVQDERGLEFTARLDSDLVELRWVDAPLGTQITVPFRPEDLPPAPFTAVRPTTDPCERFLLEVASYYVMRDPAVAFRLVEADGTVKTIEAPGFVPGRDDGGAREWREVQHPDFDVVQWAAGDVGRLGRAIRAGGSTLSNIAHNGLEVRPPIAARPLETFGYKWSSAQVRELVEEPYVAVFDSRHQLGLTLTRFELREAALPFEQELAHSVGLDVVAHALAGGPRQYPLARGHHLTPVSSADRFFPLSPGFVAHHVPVGEMVWILWTGLDAQPAATHRFMTLTALDYGDAPYRTALGPLGEAGALESSLPTESRIFQSVAVVKARYPLSELVTVLLTADTSSALARTRPAVAKNARLANAISPSPSTIVIEGRTYRRSVWATPDAPVAKVEAALTELMPRSVSRLLAVSVFERTDASDSRGIADPLASAWASTVGGGIPRDAEERRTMAVAVAEAHPEIGSLLDGWASAASSV